MGWRLWSGGGEGGGVGEKGGRKDREVMVGGEGGR